MIDQEDLILRTRNANPTGIGLASRLALGYLQRKGINPASLLAMCGLSSVALADRKRISVISQIDFLNQVSRATKDEWIGLTLAANFDLRELGLLYYVAASSSRLGDALKRLERYVSVANEALIIRIEKGAAYRVSLSYTGVPRHLDRHQAEFLALLLLRLCRRLVGKKIEPLSASFVHPRSGDQRLIQTLFGCPVQFQAYEDELNFDPAVMEIPVAGADPFLNELMVRNCEEAVAARVNNFSRFRTIVENAIAPLLPHGEAQAKKVALGLGLSERTFARRLASEGLSFGEILDQLRRDLAARYLAENLSASHIAWLLGFNQQGSFSHACRRWTGKSPTEHRRSLGRAA